MSQPDGSNVPQLHSFHTSQPSNDESTSAVQDDQNEDSIQVDQQEVKTKEPEPKPKARKASSAKDPNVIDIDEEKEEGEEEEESSGTSVLPLSKIKKIFKTDPEHVSASEAAVFSTAIATELFVQYFTEQASLIARSEKRKKLQYKDFASAVSNIEQLNFLSDTVPKTVNLKKLVDQNKVNHSTKPQADIQAQQQQRLAKGQQTLTLGKPQGAKKDEEELPESDPEEINEEEVDQDNENKIEGENNNTEEEDEVVVAEVSTHSVDQDRDVIMAE